MHHAGAGLAGRGGGLCCSLDLTAFAPLILVSSMHVQLRISDSNLKGLILHSLLFVIFSLTVSFPKAPFSAYLDRKRKNVTITAAMRRLIYY